MVGVSTELFPRGWMEQVRERGEPDTNSNSAEEDTITSGLGTGEGDVHSTKRCVLVSDGVTYAEQ